ncbi:acyltransferase family protein [Sutcliffiella cohnii]|uniref:acyltransferase family protein n=1 Tax=Sutcliffiella cohnii TaxID=33932 RepID=UPI002E1D75FF|nr:acyltransferase family protein [Sutcliffiella cohnii]
METNLNQPRKFRYEIEGLRAVAALLVAVYHIWLGNVSGGVDVFFIVSGFLITTSLLKRMERYNKIDVLDFIIGLAKRLFPMAFLVLFSVTIACIIWLPQVRWDQTIQEILASAFYFQNWQLAFNAVDYLAQNNEASPVQHFWALSLQGQFYIFWPIVIFGTAYLVKSIFKKTFKQSLVMMLFTVFTLSFIYSIYSTYTNQAWAYFNTFARVWEFSMGGIVAVLASHIVLRKTLSFVLGWVGLAAIISCGIVIQVSTVFPGYAALWPTLGGVFIILAGVSGGKYGVHRILTSKPLLKFGSISYAFYLWHWPVLTFYFIISGNETVSIGHGIVLILLSMFLSYFSTKLIEKPVRSLKVPNKNWKTVSLILAFMLPVVILTNTWSFTVEKQHTQLASAVITDEYPGATALLYENQDGIYTGDAPVKPSPIQARQDLPRMYNDGCHQSQVESNLIECVYGETDNPEYTIALVGGSHSAHWLPALEIIAEKENIKIFSYTKSNCRFSTGVDMTDSCLAWNYEVIDHLFDTKPDLVITTADVGNRLNNVIPVGFIEQWEKLDNAGINVFAIRDNPWFDFDIPTCVEENKQNVLECAVKRENVLSNISAWEKLENPPSNVYYVDLNNYICDQVYCNPVVGNILVYRDEHHLTATYSRTLAPFLQRPLKEALEINN